MTVDTDQFQAVTDELAQLRRDVEALQAESFVQGTLLSAFVDSLRSRGYGRPAPRARHLRAVDGGAS